MNPNEDFDDDKPVGRLLSRREMIALLAGTGAVLVVGTGTARAAGLLGSTTAQPVTQATPFCVVRPELTEGPYFVDEHLNRSDIRSDPADGTVKQGAKLALKFLVSAVGSACVPLPGAQVDIWHCDALGVYSDVTDRSFNTKGKKFLRGYQITDASGAASFTTIYPGWYQGRAVHIHFKIRLPNGDTTYDFTSQLFFDDDLSDKVYAAQPYASKGLPTLRNSGDGIYRSGGSQLLLDVTDDGAGGYQATFSIGLSGVTVPATATPSSGDSHTFTETGFTVSGDFWTAWLGNRTYEQSLRINGLPITAPRDEASPTDGKTYSTQWFERARFELHPENQPPYRVLLGLLGAAAVQGRENETPFKPVANPNNDLQWYPESSHTVGNSSAGGKAIAAFWASGGGIAQFGFPLSQPFNETSKDDGKSYLVQYFERQRLEYHPENAGTDFEVQLGRLGAEQVK